MKLLVVGAGYVGLVTAVCFAEMGHHVTCLDIDQKKIASLEKGIVEIHEPDLELLIKRNTASGRLRFTTDYRKAIEGASICFIAVATPSVKSPEEAHGSCDISYLLEAVRSIATVMTESLTIVIKSTVPVGTAKSVRETINEHQKNRVSFDVVSNPEFLREGTAIADCMKPDRIILGTESPNAISIMRKVYTGFTLNHDRILIMDTASAEMTKYVANAMLATRISFMNEMAGLCEQLGASISRVRVGIGSDHRIGYDYLYPGVGYGGSCFPKDLRALQAEARRVGYETPLLAAVETTNERQIDRFVEKISTYFSSFGGIAHKKIAIFGLSFKPDTDDLREAPSLKIIKKLLDYKAFLCLYDPVVKPGLNHPHITWCESEYEAATASDGVLLITEWKQFRFIDLDLLLKKMRGRGFFDGRNQYDKEEMKRKGFDYFGIGV